MKTDCLVKSLMKNEREEKTMKNTKINYLYRDADNYKAYNECIVAGEITQQQIDAIIGSLEDGEYFIPRLVGLPEKKFDTYDPQVDHPFFELNEDGFEHTDLPATLGLTVPELVDAFVQHKDNWHYIEPERALQLLSSLVDETVENELGYVQRAAKRLLELGFSESELLSLQFKKSDIEGAKQEEAE